MEQTNEQTIPSANETIPEVTAPMGQNLPQGTNNTNTEVPSVSQHPNPLTGKLVLLLIGIFIFFAGIGIAALFLRINEASRNNTTGTSPTTYITPTAVMRQIAPIASESSFLALSASISALQKDLSNITIVDQRIGPPSLELRLGFSE